MNSRCFGSTNVAIDTCVEDIAFGLAEKAAVFCHNFLPTSFFYSENPYFQGIIAITSP
jgi:hypothetical protein